MAFPRWHRSALGVKEDLAATRTPHLDGKYTSFGEVVKGQQVVDALLEGDRILRVSVDR